MSDSNKVAFEKSIKQKYSDSLWSLYNNSKSTDDLFNKILVTICNMTGSEFSILYLEDECVVDDIDISKDDKLPKPKYSEDFILTGIHSKTKEKFPREIIPTSQIKLSKFTKSGYSISFKVTTSSVIGLKNGKNENYRILIFLSEKIMLCRALFIISAEKIENEYFEILSIYISKLLDNIIPTIEAIYRRQIVTLSRQIHANNEMLLVGYPGADFQNSFKMMCESLKVEGASLIVQSLPTYNAELQLVTTYPKDIPQNRTIYPNRCFSPTQWIFADACSCIVPNIDNLRKKVNNSINCKFEENPMWCDLKDEKSERSILYCFYHSKDNYLLRFTNSKKNPSKIFHIIDRKIGQELTKTFSLLYKSVENEFRAMKIFLDVKHEFRQKITGIESAASFIDEISIKIKENDHIKKEINYKIMHIKNTINNLVTMLDRFGFPLPSIEEKQGAIERFKPFADLVKPICETFRNKAESNGNYFTFHGVDQLGFMYSSLERWKQVVENIVNNMVKYTNPGEEMMIAFARIGGGGGAIHFASRSIEIEEEEMDLIFQFKYRSKNAVLKTEDGHGIGLSIVQDIAQMYGAKILVKKNSKEGINVFTIFFPKYIFRE